MYLTMNQNYPSYTCEGRALITAIRAFVLQLRKHGVSEPNIIQAVHDTLARMVYDYSDDIVDSVLK